MERAHPHLVRDGPDECSDAFAHFAGRLVGEGDGENAHGVDTVFDEPCDALREHARFARARAGNDQQRAARVDDRVVLIGIEGVEVEHYPLFIAGRWSRRAGAFSLRGR